MQRRLYGRDTELTVRMLLVGAMLLAVYVFFMWALWAIGLSFAFIIVIAAVMLGIQYFASDKLVLMTMRAKEVSPSEAPKLHAMVERLAIMGGIPKPRIAISELPIPNAFATGRSPKHSVVAVTTGLMNRLTDSELEAVLAHELTHIKNRDVTVITIASFFSMVAAMIVNNFLWIFLFSGGGRRDGRDSGGQALILIYFVSLLVYVVSFLLIRALSRYRELAADRGGAILTGAPSNLASALIKISDSVRSGIYRIPEQDLRRTESANAFFIIPAIKGEALAELFSTHPSLEVRLERLRRMQQEMEGV